MNEPVIPDGESAIVTRNGQTDFELLIPDADGSVPVLTLVLTACFIRLTDDEQFFQEQIDWLRENMPAAN